MANSVQQAAFRYDLIERAKKNGEPIARICKEAGISRKTYYKWQHRWLLAGCTKDSLQNKRVVERQTRSINEEIENKILTLVVKHPEYSKYQLADYVNGELGIRIGAHGIYNLLKRNGVSQLDERMSYSRNTLSQISELNTQPTICVEDIKPDPTVTSPAVLPAPPPQLIHNSPNWWNNRLVRFCTYLDFFIILSVIISLGLFKWSSLLLLPGNSDRILGMSFAFIALVSGSLFFFYSIKYYITIAIVLSFSQQEGLDVKRENKSRRKGRELISKIISFLNATPLENPINAGLKSNLDSVVLTRTPFVSIHIPFFNEKNVVERSIKASLNFDYPGYEVILCDDSTDETTSIIRNYQSKYLFRGESLTDKDHYVVNETEGWSLTTVEVRQGVFLKHLHRTTRGGFKGGALSVALRLVDPRTEFISIFDADFVP